jgi:hypothetical protein
MKVLLFKTRASFSLFGHSERHQGLKIKTSGLKKSYKSLKTAAALRPSLTNFFAVIYPTHIAFIRASVRAPVQNIDVPETSTIDGVLGNDLHSPRDHIESIRGTYPPKVATGADSRRQSALQPPGEQSRLGWIEAQQ